jgi:hypothetical protein
MAENIMDAINPDKILTILYDYRPLHCKRSKSTRLSKDQHRIMQVIDEAISTLQYSISGNKVAEDIIAQKLNITRFKKTRKHVKKLIEMLEISQYNTLMAIIAENEMLKKYWDRHNRRIATSDFPTLILSEHRKPGFKRDERAIDKLLLNMHEANTTYSEIVLPTNDVQDVLSILESCGCGTIHVGVDEDEISIISFRILENESGLKVEKYKYEADKTLKEVLERNA